MRKRDFNTRDAACTASLRESRLYDYRPKDQDRIDRTDHRDKDLNRQHITPRAPRTRASMERLLPGPTENVPALTQRECEDVFHAISALEADVKRRNMLFQLALALGGAPSLALLRHLTPEESENLAYAIHTPGGIDARSVATIEKLTAQCRRLDDTIGPRAVLPIVDAKRDLLTRILDRETLSQGMRDRLVTAYAQLSQLAGFLHYDLTDYDGATSRFNDALKAALEVTDPTMIAYVHSWLSDMASFRNDPGLALDHSFAAQGWAREKPEPPAAGAYDAQPGVGARPRKSEGRQIGKAGQHEPSPPPSGSEGVDQAKRSRSGVFVLDLRSG